MPISKAPFTRHYWHTASRGKERTVTCSGCGREVPRYKTFIRRRQFRINDPVLLQQMDRRMIHLMPTIERFCPSCARFRGIAQPGKAIRKKGFR